MLHFLKLFVIEKGINYMFPDNDRNNYEKVIPFDWNLDLEMNLDFAIWENEFIIMDEKENKNKGK